MMDDPIVEEVRHTRQRIFAECDGDLDRLIARLKAADSKNKDRLVTIENVQKRASTPKAGT
ncbi:MAG: hypothetical protein HQ581_08735 [Planctomycetes bacterium]|nr:hypothetical protein [Planctomycetota bacterium]